jgi:hypothetical protein
LIEIFVEEKLNFCASKLGSKYRYLENFGYRWQYDFAIVEKLNVYHKKYDRRYRGE